MYKLFSQTKMQPLILRTNGVLCSAISLFGVSLKICHVKMQILEIDCHILKLANLPKGCSFTDLLDVLDEVHAKTCFIPKKRDNPNYQRERFTYVCFASHEDLVRAQQFSYILSGRALQWVSVQTCTCRECGSFTHLVCSCKEANRKQAIVDKNFKNASIYKKYNAKPTHPKGFIPRPPSGGYDIDEYNYSFKFNESNWDDSVSREQALADWENPRDTPEGAYTYANAIKANRLHGPIKNPRAPSVAKPRSSASPPPNVPRHSKPKTPISGTKFSAARQDSCSGPSASEFNQRMDKLEALLGNFATQLNSLTSRVIALESAASSAHKPSSVNLNFTAPTEFINTNNKRVRFAKSATPNTNAATVA